MKKTSKYSPVVEGSSLGLNCLAFVCSILGFVLFFCLVKKSPKKARACLIWSFVGGIFDAIVLKACLT